MKFNNENLILKGNRKRIILANNNIYSNSSGRNFQINFQRNNMKNKKKIKKINYQHKKYTYHKSKSKKSKCFYICYNCDCRGYYCDRCLTPGCFRCNGIDCKCFHHFCNCSNF